MAIERAAAARAAQRPRPHRSAHRALQPTRLAGRARARAGARRPRGRERLSIGLIDLDELKSFNDRWGHAAGDRLLLTAAARWRRRLRLTDLLARIGGDEFAVTLPGCTLAEATALGDQLRDALPEGLSCSVGVAEWVAGRAGGAACSARADRALYAAKDAGATARWRHRAAPSAAAEISQPSVRYPDVAMAGRGLIDRALRLGESKQFRDYEKRVEEINRFEPEMELLDDAELRAEADALRERARGGESLDDLLPEAFALCREAGKRTLGQRHYDVQLIGGMVLHSGAIAEMKTGEGKTLTATLAVFLNTLAGDSVHLVTVNDYLARRDAEWMRPLYEALGVTVGVLQDTDLPEHGDRRHAAYAGRRHLRDQLRVRLRLPARQHGAVAGADASSATTASRSSTRSTTS